MDNLAKKTDARRARLFEIIRQKTSAEKMIARIRKGARHGHSPEDLDSFRAVAARSLRAQPEARPHP